MRHHLLQHTTRFTVVIQPNAQPHAHTIILRLWIVVGQVKIAQCLCRMDCGVIIFAHTVLTLEDAHAIGQFQTFIIIYWNERQVGFYQDMRPRLVCCTRLQVFLRGIQFHGQYTIRVACHRQRFAGILHPIFGVRDLCALQVMTTTPLAQPPHRFLTGLSKIERIHRHSLSVHCQRSQQYHSPIKRGIGQYLHRTLATAKRNKQSQQRCTI